MNADQVLEFTIKSYNPEEHPGHEGVTWALSKIKPGEELLIEKDPWGTIDYKGKGVFLAGGAGITPFIAIFKDLHQKGELTGNKLIFSNKEKRDIILEKEFEATFDTKDRIFTLSQEKLPGYEHGRIDAEMIKRFYQGETSYAYVCGPKPFVAGMKEILTEIGAKTESVVFEE